MESSQALVRSGSISGLVATETELDAQELVAEFRRVVGLSEVDAHRSAFCVIAYYRGWSTARIGRYLGISRARVGQRIDRLQQYAAKHGEKMPLMAGLMQNAPARDSRQSGGQELPVAMDAQQWADKRFAQGMLRLVSQ